MYAGRLGRRETDRLHLFSARDMNRRYSDAGRVSGRERAGAARRSSSARRLRPTDYMSIWVDIASHLLALALAVLSNASRSPLASFEASSFAQKCMKNSRGCSVSM